MLRLLLGLNLALQAADWVLTYHGLARGFEEGNVFLAHLMTQVGVGPALVLVKGLSCVCLLGVFGTAPATAWLGFLVVTPLMTTAVLSWLTLLMGWW